MLHTIAMTTDDGDRTVDTWDGKTWSASPLKGLQAGATFRIKEPDGEVIRLGPTRSLASVLEAEPRERGDSPGTFELDACPAKLTAQEAKS